MGQDHSSGLWTIVELHVDKQGGNRKRLRGLLECRLDLNRWKGDFHSQDDDANAVAAGSGAGGGFMGYCCLFCNQRQPIILSAGKFSRPVRPHLALFSCHWTWGTY